MIALPTSHSERYLIKRTKPLTFVLPLRANSSPGWKLLVHIGDCLFLRQGLAVHYRGIPTKYGIEIGIYLQQIAKNYWLSKKGVKETSKKI